MTQFARPTPAAAGSNPSATILVRDLATHGLDTDERLPQRNGCSRFNCPESTGRGRRFAVARGSKAYVFMAYVASTGAEASSGVTHRRQIAGPFAGRNNS